MSSAIKASTISCVWNGGKSQSLVKLISNQRQVGRAEGLDQLLSGVAQIEQVDGHGQREVAVGVEALAEAVALIGQVGADGELRLELGLHVAGRKPLGVELLRHRLAREIGDVSQHPRDGQTDHRAVALIVVLPVVIGRIAEDGVAADDVEGHGLAGQPRRRCRWRLPRPVDRHSAWPRSGPCAAQRSAHDRAKPADAQVIDQPPLHIDDVAHGDDGKIGGVGAAGFGIDAVRPGGAAATAQNVRADDEVAIGVDGLARPDDNVPPAGIVGLVVLGDVRIAGQGRGKSAPRCRAWRSAGRRSRRPRSLAAIARQVPVPTVRRKSHTARTSAAGHGGRYRCFQKGRCSLGVEVWNI